MDMLRRDALGLMDGQTGFPLSRVVRRVVCGVVLALMCVVVLLPLEARAAQSYDVKITTYDMTSGTIGGVGTITYYPNGWRAQPRITGETITVGIDSESNTYRLEADNLPAGYRFLGWKRVTQGQAIDDAEFIHPFRQDYYRNGSFYTPQGDNETLYAVYKQVPIDNKVGIQVSVKDVDGNPVPGVSVGLLQGYGPDYETLTIGESDADGKARTAPDVLTLETNWVYPELFWPFAPQYTPYPLDVPEGYVLPQSAVFMRYAPWNYYRGGAGADRYLLTDADDAEYYYGFELSMYSSSEVLFGERLRQYLLEFELQPIPTGGIRLIKHDAEDSAKTLPSAEFQIVLSIERDEAIQATIPDIYGEPQEITAEEWTDDNAEDPETALANIKAVYENDFITLDGQKYHDGDVVATITTDENGVAETGLILPLLTKHGQKVTYSVVETKAPSGYEIDTPDVATDVELTAGEYLEYTVSDTAKEEEKPEDGGDSSEDKEEKSSDDGTTTGTDTKKSETAKAVKRTSVPATGDVSSVPSLVLLALGCLGLVGSKTIREDERF